MSKTTSAKIVVLGATGHVGREVLQALAETGVPLANVQALATASSVGSVLSYGEDDINVIGSANFDYSSVQLVISALPLEVAQQMLPTIAKQCRVIDCSPAFRMDPDVPLVVGGVNDAALSAARRNMVTIPGAMACLLAQAIAPLHGVASITRVVVSTYQATVSAGRAAMDELFSQTRSIFVNDPMVKEQFSKQIAFNVIPQIGNFRDDGQTEEELMLAAETKKILDPKVKFAATCARVPTFVGSALAVSLECANEMDAGAARTALRRNPGISVVDHRVEEGYVTPAEAAGEDSIYISRIREDSSVDNGLQLWVVADTIRAGVAQNAVRVALIWLGSTVEVKRLATVH